MKKGFDKLSKDYWTRIVPQLSSRLKPGDMILMINDLSYFSPVHQDPESQDFLGIFESEITVFSNRMNAKGIPVVFVKSLPFARDAKCEPAVAAKQWFNQIGEGPCDYISQKETLMRMER